MSEDGDLAKAVLDLDKNRAPRIENFARLVEEDGVEVAEQLDNIARNIKAATEGLRSRQNKLAVDKTAEALSEIDSLAEFCNALLHAREELKILAAELEQRESRQPGRVESTGD